MKTSKLNRRQFLLAAGAGSAATATALIASKPVATAPAVPVIAAAEPVKGYHLSAHIEKYYKTTEI